jgi:hypothetical protein
MKLHYFGGINTSGSQVVVVMGKVRHSMGYAAQWWITLVFRDKVVEDPYYSLLELRY